jgi:glycosyltransferase involved in cell wall biosynthesis
MPFKVIIISNYLPDKQDSMLLFSELISSLLSNKELIVETIRPIERAGKLRCFLPKLKKWLFYIDKYLFFPLDLLAHSWKTRGVQDAVYHITDHSNALYSLLLHKRPLVVTCHDVLAIRSAIGEIPENPTGFNGKLLQKTILYGLKRVQRIVCVSEHTACQLRRLIGNSSSKITTALNPLNFDYYPLSNEVALQKTSRLGDAVANAIRDGFILHVGGNQWYKNRLGVCKIYTHMARERIGRGATIPHLILAGKEPSAELRRYVAENSDLPVRFVLSPAPEELQALYSLATVLLFPSHEEGFGWPILEAMACGCPVVTTSQPPMTEVGDEAAIYIDPLKIAEATHILNEVLGWSAARRLEQVQKGFENLRRFSRADFQEHYLSAYLDVANHQLCAE